MGLAPDETVSAYLGIRIEGARCTYDRSRRERGYHYQFWL